MLKFHFTITAPMVRAISRVEYCRGVVSALPFSNATLAVLQTRLLIEAIHDSRALDGEYRTPPNINAILREGASPDNPAEAQAVTDYIRVASWIWQRAVNRGLFTPGDIAQMHRLAFDGLLLPGELGHWRTGQTSFLHGGAADDQLAYIPPEPAVIPALLHDLTDWVNQASDTPPLIMAGVAHAWLTAIRPFTDGNARIGRGLAFFLLNRAGYDFDGLIEPGHCFAADPPGYFARLTLAPTFIEAMATDLTDWLEYFLQGFAEDADQATSRAAALLTSEADPQTERDLPATSWRLLSCTRQHGTISLSEAAALLGDIPRRSLQRHLHRLVEDGYLYSVGNARALRYSCVPIDDGAAEPSMLS